MRRGFLIQVLAVLLAVAGCAQAEPAVIPTPGQYEMEGGYGSLSIDAPATAGGKMTFAIVTAGANGHTCDIAGEIDADAIARVTVEDTGDVCMVSFAADPATPGIVIVGRVEESICLDFCGMRASFTGDFRAVAAGQKP